ncbi:hypothetical protein DEO72_LG2g953 [Vigna unguiculata]|uniref:Uncharacterized protein n=1 Tax=Vigna unguiculata TaxID=3917 RepID=A0A4D6KZT8_VIGUN|nr:hypothetical protein DEO72_LG2g953 [Vigna unguiculata]
MMVSAIWEAEKAMLVRFNPKTDLHVEAVKYDLRLSRANITYHCCFPAHPNSSDSLVRILLQTLIKVVINKHFPLGCSNLELKPVAATSKKLYLKCNIAIITTGNLRPNFVVASLCVLPCGLLICINIKVIQHKV